MKKNVFLFSIVLALIIGYSFTNANSSRAEDLDLKETGKISPDKKDFTGTLNTYIIGSSATQYPGTLNLTISSSSSTSTTTDIDPGTGTGISGKSKLEKLVDTY